MRLVRLLALGVAVVSLTAACGDGDPAEDADAAPPSGDGNMGTGRYLPIGVGASWTYKITDPMTGATAMKTSTVEAEEDIGGMKAGITGLRVRTEKTDGATVSWQVDTGTAVVRHREQSFDLTNTMTLEEYYDAYKLRVDEDPAHLVMGAQWSETFVETNIDPIAGTTMATKTENWTVEAVNEQVTVPAGTFSCIKLHRVGTTIGQSDKRYWYARGVGKIKETGGQTEELMAFTPAP